tara:strand:+ start:32689 stop:35172 length:2484 start_codon:yes stop_codon:yes gene_type:complete
MAKNKFSEELKEAAKIQAKLHDGIGSYFEVMKDLGETQRNLNVATEQQLKLSRMVLEVRAELRAIEEGHIAATDDDIDNLKIKEKYYKTATKHYTQQIPKLQKLTDELAEQVKHTNKMALGFNTLGNIWNKAPGQIKKAYGKLKSTGVFDLDKSLRLAGRSMNVIGDSFEGFSKNINTANKTTGMWGVGTKALAKAQQSYSEEIGRSVVLGEEGLIAIGEMAEGTNLGAEGAANMMAEMDKFNISAVGAKDIIEETVKSAAKMGVNSSKAIKTLQTQLKLSQKFHFKGGVKGLTTMANEAARLKLDMDGIAGLAEKVFRPEGAVEMAAQLAVMGGEFAKLGDPFTLMFKARNDFGAFAKDIASATVEFVDFNKETGETQIKGGLAADRMREIANVTGIQIDKLHEMASMQKRIQEYGSLIPPIISDKEDRDLVASLTKMKDGKAVIRIDNKDINLRELDATMLDYYKQNQKTLAERAEHSQTFDDILINFMNTLKSTLLPFVQGITKGLGEPLTEMIKSWKQEGFYEKIEDFGESAGQLVSKVGGWITDFAKYMGPWKTLATIIGGNMIFNGLKWVGNGLSLAKGFQIGTRGFGGGGSGGSGVFSQGGASSSVNPNKWATGRGARNMSRLGKGSGVVAGILAGYDEYSENKENGMDGGENAGRTGMRAGGAGLGAWGGAALGTAIFPGVGTVIGAAVGGLAGSYAGDKGGDMAYGSNGKSNAINVQDGIVKFDDNDKFMSVNDSTMIAGTNKGGNKDLAKSISGSGDVKHTFDDLKIKIDLSSDSSWLNTIGQDIVKDRTFVREITNKIQEEIRMAIGGGKLSPNPI